MARTIGDVALLFRMLSGHDPADPVSAPVLLREPAMASCGRTRIGYFEDDGLVPVTAETRAAVHAAAAALRDAGFPWSRFGRGRWKLLRQVMVEVLCAVRGNVLCAGDSRQRDELSPDFQGVSRAWRRSAPALTAAELLNAWAELDVLRAKTLEEMRKYPVLLCPVASVPAFRHGERSWNVEGRDG